MCERLEQDQDARRLPDVVTRVGLSPVSGKVSRAYVEAFVRSPEDVFRGVEPVGVDNPTNTACYHIAMIRALLALHPPVVAVALRGGNNMADAALGALQAMAEPGRGRRSLSPGADVAAVGESLSDGAGTVLADEVAVAASLSDGGGTVLAGDVAAVGGESLRDGAGTVLADDVAAVGESLRYCFRLRRWVECSAELGHDWKVAGEAHAFLHALLVLLSST